MYSSTTDGPPETSMFHVKRSHIRDFCVTASEIGPGKYANCDFYQSIFARTATASAVVDSLSAVDPHRLFPYPLFFFRRMHTAVSWRHFSRYGSLLSPVYTIQPVVKPVDNRVNVCIHDTTGCQTCCQSGCQSGLTTGCIVYTAGCQTGYTTGLTTGRIV